MNPSEQLFKSLNSIVKNYPQGIVRVPEKRMGGTAFFPAGDGIYKEGNWKPRNHYPIMVVGQDYDNEKNFEIVFGSPSQSEVSNSNKTWQNLKKILGEETLAKCFFTNAIMGLREGDSKNTGPSKAFLRVNNTFLIENVNFFKEQLTMVQPKLIICLGTQLPRFMGSCFPGQTEALSSVRSFNELDSKLHMGKSVVKYKGGEASIIFITHPALYYANVGRRRNGKGLEFEMKLIKEALGELVK